MSEMTIHVTDDNFDNEVLQAKVPVLVDFWAPWCGPCRAIAPSLDALAKEYNQRVKIVKMNVDENAHVPATFGVRSIPYLVLFKGGEVVDSVVGAVPKAKIEDMITQAL